MIALEQEPTQSANLRIVGHGKRAQARERARQIREAYDTTDVTAAELATRFGLARSSVLQIIYNRACPDPTYRRTNPTRRKGFASMDKACLAAISSKGGRAAHEKGTAYEFTPEEARAAGHKGGLAISSNRAHMAETGRRGGKA